MKGYSFDSKTAFVFSGGASLGAVEVGALKAIVEEGIQADLVLGTSVGSLNGAMYAHNPTIKGVKDIENVWLNIKVWNVFTPSPITPVFNITTFGLYLISPKNLRKLIKENMKFTRIEETQIPLYIIATDIKSGDEIVFDKGLALEALMSSAAIPGVFPPQRMSDFIIVDGGIVNNAPISTAIRLGAQRIVIFPIGVPSPDQEPKTVAEMLIHSFIYILNRQLSTDIQLYKDKAELIIVPPPDSVNVGPHDFSKSKQLIDMSYKKAKDWLKTEGFSPNAHKHPCPCDVHTPMVNLMEAVVPQPAPKVTTRVKEGIKHTTKDVRKSIEETTGDVFQELTSVAVDIKDKLLGKKKKPEEEEKEEKN